MTLRSFCSFFFSFFLAPVIAWQQSFPFSPFSLLRRDLWERRPFFSPPPGYRDNPFFLFFLLRAKPTLIHPFLLSRFFFFSRIRSSFFFFPFFFSLTEKPEDVFVSRVLSFPPPPGVGGSVLLFLSGSGRPSVLFWAKAMLYGLQAPIFPFLRKGAPSLLSGPLMKASVFADRRSQSFFPPPLSRAPSLLPACLNQPNSTGPFPSPRREPSLFFFSSHDLFCPFCLPSFPIFPCFVHRETVASFFFFFPISANDGFSRGGGGPLFPFPLAGAVFAGKIGCDLFFFFRFPQNRAARFGFFLFFLSPVV